MLVSAVQTFITFTLNETVAAFQPSIASFKSKFRRKVECHEPDCTVLLLDKSFERIGRRLQGTFFELLVQVILYDETNTSAPIMLAVAGLASQTVTWLDDHLDDRIIAVSLTQAASLVKETKQRTALSTTTVTNLVAGQRSLLGILAPIIGSTALSLLVLAIKWYLRRRKKMRERRDSMESTQQSAPTSQGEVSMLSTSQELDGDLVRPSRWGRVRRIFLRSPPPAGIDGTTEAAGAGSAATDQLTPGQAWRRLFRATRPVMRNLSVLPPPSDINISNNAQTDMQALHHEPASQQQLITRLRRAVRFART